MIKVDLIEEIDYANFPSYRKLNVLIEAINDWERNINTIEEYILLIQDYLGGSLSLNKKDINQILSEKNVFDDAWKMESISTLLDILDDNELLNVALDNLILDIKIYLSKK